MFTSISDGFKNYYDQIPEGSLKSIGASAAISFAFSSIFNLSMELNVSRRLTCAALAATATAVHALTTPIFNYIFSNDGSYKAAQELVHTVCILQLMEHFSDRSLKIKPGALSVIRAGGYAVDYIFKSKEPLTEGDWLGFKFDYKNTTPYYIYL